MTQFVISCIFQQTEKIMVRRIGYDKSSLKIEGSLRDLERCGTKVSSM